MVDNNSNQREPHVKLNDEDGESYRVMKRAGYEYCSNFTRHIARGVVGFGPTRGLSLIRLTYWQRGGGAGIPVKMTVFP